MSKTNVVPKIKKETAVEESILKKKTLPRFPIRSLANVRYLKEATSRSGMKKRTLNTVNPFARRSG
jgi:hypothetical protein